MHDFASYFELNETDFSVFRFLNKMGALPASSVSVRLSINRTTVFSSLKRLKEKGLIYEIPKKGGSFFAVIEQEQLEMQAKSKLLEEEKKYHQLLDNFAFLQTEKISGGILPKVAFFEGENGIISLFRKTLSLSKQQEAFLTLEKIPAPLLSFLQNEFIAEKKSKKVFSKVLVARCERTERYKNLDSVSNRETRFVAEKTPFETEIIIAGDSVAIVDFRDGGIGVLIESLPVSNTMRGIFSLLWNTAV